MAPIPVGQRVVDRKRTPVLNDNTPKLAERASNTRSTMSALTSSRIGKLSFRPGLYATVVPNSAGVGQALKWAQLPSKLRIRRDDPLALTKPRQPAQRVDAPLRQHPLELPDEVAKISRSHSSLHYVMVLASSMIGDFGWDFKKIFHINQ